MEKITKYAIRIGVAKIEKVICDRATEKAVWVNGFRKNRFGLGICYYDTWEDAKERLCEAQRREVNTLKHETHKANSLLGQIQKLKKPEEE